VKKKRQPPLRPKKNPRPPDRSAASLNTVFIGGEKTRIKKEER